MHDAVLEWTKGTGLLSELANSKTELAYGGTGGLVSVK